MVCLCVIDFLYGHPETVALDVISDYDVGGSHWLVLRLGYS
jgi:hypothetical protein